MIVSDVQLVSSDAAVSVADGDEPFGQLGFATNCLAR
jgi:hypothetical protein